MPVPLSEASLLETLNRSGSAWTVRRLALLLGVSIPTIYKHVRLGKLPHFRVGHAVRFDGPTVARSLRRTH